MRTYLTVSTIVFALITVAHVLRTWFEGVRVLSEPVFIASTLISVGLTSWGIYLLRTGRGKQAN